MKKRSLDCSNERFVKKKGNYLSPALPYLTRCTIGVWTIRLWRFPILHKMNKMKKRSLDCSNERFVKKKGGYLLSRIALFDTVYHRCMDDIVVVNSHIAQNEQMKKTSEISLQGLR